MKENLQRNLCINSPNIYFDITNLIIASKYELCNMSGTCSYTSLFLLLDL